MSYPFQANGIVASADGQWLIVVNSNTGTLYRVDPSSGEALAIDLGGQSVPYGDGLVLDKTMLYVVQNYLNKVTGGGVERRLDRRRHRDRDHEPGILYTHDSGQDR